MQKHIAGTLHALTEQSYDKAKFEVIVVDNGSRDDTVKIAKSFPFKVLFELENQNADAARNKGIEAASGDIIVFTDADCIPDPNWLMEGIKYLESSNSDMIAGNIQFSFENKNSAAEIYDATSNLQHKNSVGGRNIAFTANLFVKRRVFDALGLFPSNSLGGGDIILTNKATSYGFKLRYCKTASISHPTRGFSDLCIKGFRIGREKAAAHSVLKGTNAKQQNGGNKHRNTLAEFCSRPHIKNLNILYLYRSLRGNQYNSSPIHTALIYCCGLLYIGSGAFGILFGKLYTNPEKSRKSMFRLFESH
jgi:glycosyltransferase involved in cell wall biosynthesis